MPVLEKSFRLYNTTEDDGYNKVLYKAGEKEFYNLSETEGFTSHYTQYNSALFLLNTCYSLLVEAGYSAIEKDEIEQSLKVWGLKLFFSNIVDQFHVNLVAPGTNFEFIVGGRDDNNFKNYLKPESCTPDPRRKNHYLQKTIVTSYLLSTALPYNGTNLFVDATEELFFANSTSVSSQENIDMTGYKNSVILGQQNKEMFVVVTLRCSNDAIYFTIHIVNEDTGESMSEQPLLSIFKGKDLVLDKDILILGQKLERAPFICIANTSMSQRDANNIHIIQANIKHNFFGPQQYYGCSTLQSGYICSGSNLIYYPDDSFYTQSENTLYLDFDLLIKENDENKKISRVKCTGNNGRYEIYGVNDISVNKNLKPNRYYNIDTEKYWCMHNVIPFIPFNAIENQINIMSSNATVLGNSFWLDLLGSMTNCFGLGKWSYKNDPALYHQQKQTIAKLLNPAILMRIDEIIH